jgi:hypothetical protein
MTLFIISYRSNTIWLSLEKVRSKFQDSLGDRKAAIWLSLEKVKLGNWKVGKQISHDARPIPSFSLWTKQDWIDSD